MNKEVKELAKAIFLKNNTQRYITNNTEKEVEAVINSSIEMAKIFYKIFEEKKNETK